MSMFNQESIEEIFTVYRIFSEKSQNWSPAIKDKASHEISPVWVAGVLYMIMDRYISCVSDESQIEFQEQAFSLFEKMIKEGAEEHIYKLGETD